MSGNGIAIIGAGPAGIAAALQLARYESAPFVYESGSPGGLLFDAGTIENYPGFPKGIEGPELAELFAAGLAGSGAVVCPEEVISVDYAGGVFRVKSGKAETGTEAEFSRVLIATGTRPAPLEGIEFDSEETEGGIEYGIRGIRSVSGMSIAIIGAGDAAFDYAVTLSARNDVVILQRGEKPRCNAALARRAAGRERITVLENAKVENIARREGGEYSLSLCGTGCGTIDRMTADHVVAAVGRVPREIELLPGLSEDIGMLVGTNRLRLAGDVMNGMHRQTSIAVGDGVRAAMEFHEGKSVGR